MNRNERLKVAEDTVKEMIKYKEPVADMVKISEYKKLEQENWFSYKGNVISDSVVSYIHKNKDKHLTVLNFASAKNPGGGFLSGSNAQEESLARASNMTAGLNLFMEDYYEVNRSLNNPLYTDTMIYLDGVTFFKDDNGKKVQEVVCDLITSPAPNAGVAKNRGISERDIDVALKTRIYNIIQLAVDKKAKHLALGAFGCGVFKNDSARVAMHFKNAINQLVEKDSMDIKFVIFGAIPKGFN